jgi:hypothetical protein
VAFSEPNLLIPRVRLERSLNRPFLVELLQVERRPHSSDSPNLQLQGDFSLSLQLLSEAWQLNLNSQLRQGSVNLDNNSPKGRFLVDKLNNPNSNRWE